MYFKYEKYWPNNAAPDGIKDNGRLDRSQYIEFCYYAEQPEHQQAAPPASVIVPPDDFEPGLSWSRMHHEANDVLGCDAGAPAGATVSLRDVREIYFECLGFWPTNAAPAGMEGGTPRQVPVP